MTNSPDDMLNDVRNIARAAAKQGDAKALPDLADATGKLSDALKKMHGAGDSSGPKVEALARNLEGMAEAAHDLLQNTGSEQSDHDAVLSEVNVSDRKP